MSKIVFQQTKKKTPPHTPMRFQSRDGAILQALYSYDGVLARRHLKDMFWPTASKQAMERRLAILHKNHYLDWPNTQQRRTKPIPEPIVWLGWKGILYLAGQAGRSVDHPANSGENQMRLLDRRLRKAGLRWQREPRWNQLAHDLVVIDFRLALEIALQSMPPLALETWIPEGTFLSNPDVIEFNYLGKDNTRKRKKKGVRPDGYFILLDQQRQAQRLPARARFLLELDNATHPLGRFATDKIAAGLAYIKSREYKKRFGCNSGHWLVVCSSERRMHNLKTLTEDVAGKNASTFYFTTIASVNADTILAAPIWYRGGSNTMQHLLD